MIAATHVPGERLCRACFDGMYPIKLPEPELLGKHLLERVPAPPGRRGAPMPGAARD
jgi:amidophosphoribosyltransferase